MMFRTQLNLSGLIIFREKAKLNKIRQTRAEKTAANEEVQPNSNEKLSKPKKVKRD